MGFLTSHLDTEDLSFSNRLAGNHTSLSAILTLSTDHTADASSLVTHLPTEYAGRLTKPHSFAVSKSGIAHLPVTDRGGSDTTDLDSEQRE